MSLPGIIASMIYAFLGFIMSIVIGFWAVFIYRDQVKPPSIEQTLPSRALEGTVQVQGERSEPFRLQPPRQSLRGVIEAPDGSVVISKRDETSGRQAVPGDTITDGESILTEAESAIRIVFEQLGSIALNQNSQISFATTLPDSFLLEQNRGIVGYTTREGQVMTVRTQGIVFEVQEGDAILESNQEEGYVTVQVKEGQVKLAYLDASWETLVYTVKKGETATITNGEFSLVEEE